MRKELKMPRMREQCVAHVKDQTQPANDTQNCLICKIQTEEERTENDVSEDKSQTLQRRKTVRARDHLSS